MRSELPWVQIVKLPYPNGVIADRQRVGKNAFSVEKTGDSNPGVARFALQPWATRRNFGVGWGSRWEKKFLSGTIRRSAAGGGAKLG